MNRFIYLMCLGVPFTALGVGSHQKLLTEQLLGNAYQASKDNRIQVKVANQFSMPGSSTDCGYHALYNGFAVADLVSTSEADCLGRLGSVEMRAKVFGLQDSAWRKSVIEIRADKKAGERIAEALIRCVNPKITSDEREAIINIIRNSVSDVAKESHSVRADVVEYLIPVSLSKGKLQASLDAKLRDETVSDKAFQVYEKIKLLDIDSFIKLEEIRTSVERDLADWLRSDEMIELPRDESSKRIFKTRLDEHNLFMLGDSGGIAQPIALDDRVSGKQFKQLQADIQNPESIVLAIILIYVKDGWDPFGWVTALQHKISPPTEAEKMDSDTSSASHGHWITLVINKVGLQKQYIIADSGGNASRLDHNRVNEVIALLENDTSKASKESKATFQRSAGNLWRQWQKPFKIILGSAAMILACVFAARHMNSQKKQKSS